MLGVEIGDAVPDGADAAVDFTQPDAVVGNVERCLERGVPCVVGTTGAEAERERGRRARAGARRCGLRRAELRGRRRADDALRRRGGRHLPRAEIVELHHETKRDAPSGTAKATAAAMGGDPAIHSVRLPGLVAHQEVLLGGPGQLLTIRHDTLSREAFVPGVLLALERLPTLPAGADASGSTPLL